MGTILMVLIVLLLVGALPAWPHSKNWGYMPTGFFSILFVVLIVLVLTGRL